MIAQAIEALRRAAKDPGYLPYYLKNVDILRDHFPALNQWWRVDRKRLRLGGPRTLSQLHVILRTTDRVLNVSGPRDLEALGVVTKRDVIRTGACSLFPAARRFADEHGDDAIRITIVTDRLSDEGKALYVQTAERHALPVEFVESRSGGNGPSFQTQVDVALRDPDDAVALFLEDDYLLSPDALTVPYAVLSECSNVVGLNPHFHPDRIRRRDVRRFCAIDGRVFARVDSSCCTFFVPVADLKRHLRHFRRYDGWEKGSINEVWKRGLFLAPFGWTLAEHLHKFDLSPVFRAPSDGRPAPDAPCPVPEALCPVPEAICPVPEAPASGQSSRQTLP